MDQPGGPRFSRRSGALSSWQSGQRPGTSPPGGSGAGTIARPLAAAGVLLVALVMAFAVVNLINRDEDDGGEPAGNAAATASTAVAGNPTSTSQRIPDGPEGNTDAAPALRIHPQRAAAGLPLNLQVDGIGCPGSSGTLSITEVGTAGEAGGLDRLVVRRRFDVDPVDRSFHVDPLLVGQPPGTYRVAIECERFRTADAPAALPTRQVFELTELLELTGPLAAREFQVSPLQPDPDLTTQFSLSGAGCTGVSPRVEVLVFPPRSLPLSVTPPPATVRLQPPVLAERGTWTATTSVAAAAAQGTYTFEATCFDGPDVQFPYVARHVHFGPLSTNEVAGALAGLFDIFNPQATGAAAGPPAKTGAAATQAVPGTPRYTG